MRHQSIAGFAALLAITMLAAGAVAIIARQGENGNTGPSTGVSGYVLSGTIGGPLIPTTPVDVAVDIGGRIFVADISLNRVLAFTPGGDLDTTWADGGMSERFAFPAGLAIGPDNSLYVLQLGNTEVHVLDEDGTERDVWSIDETQGFGGASVPTSIAVDDEGIVYIPDQRSQQIHRYAQDGGELDAWSFPPVESSTGEIQPRDLVIRDGELLLSYDQGIGGEGGLLVFDSDGQGRSLDELPVEAPARGNYAPGSLATGPAGEIAVVFLPGDEGAAPVIGTVDDGWMPEGIRSMTAINGLVLPGIALNRDGHLLVADPARQRVRIYDAGGSVAGDIQSSASEGLFAGLDEIIIGSDGLLYAADPMLGRVTAYSPDGNVEASYQLPGEPEAPLTTGFTRLRMRIAVDPSGAVYVADELTGRIAKFSQDGELIDPDWAESADPNQDIVATILAAGNDEQLYLVDINAEDRVRVFSVDGEDLGLLVEPFWDGAIQDIAVAGDVIYTVELGAGTSPVRSFSTAGEYLGELANLSSGGGNANRTGFALAPAPDGDLLIAAVNVASGPEFEYQILRLNSDGGLDRLGTLDVPFTTLPDIAVDATGTLYLAAPNDQTIYVYEPENGSPAL